MEEEKCHCPVSLLPLYNYFDELDTVPECVCDNLCHNEDGLTVLTTTVDRLESDELHML